MASESKNSLTEDQRKAVQQIVKLALAEDLGSLGDVTTQATIAESTQAEGRFLAKADGVLSGLAVAEIVFAEVDASIQIEWSLKDGDKVQKGTYFGSVKGKARSIVVGERLALNLMQRMSGIASATRRMVDAVGKHKAQILDTRKTAPNLRVIDKMGHAAGGGTNHRFGLYDMVMIKDNHVTAAGGVTKAVTAAHQFLASKGLAGKVPIEVETRTLAEVEEAMKCLPLGTAADAGVIVGGAVAASAGIDRIMLDNMVKVDDAGNIDTSMLAAALKIVNGRVQTEASGNVTLATVPQIAATGVDFISTGAVTHSVIALDISLKIRLV